MHRNLITLAALALSGCANISATALQPDGITEISGAASGFRYYLPRPYLLVTELPAPPAQSTGAPGTAGLGAGGAGGAGAGGAGGAGAGKPPNTTDNSQSQPASPAPVSDLRFLASSVTYIAKVIYLPDYAHPMAVSMSTGLFGIATLQLTLQGRVDAH